MFLMSSSLVFRHCLAFASQNSVPERNLNFTGSSVWLNCNSRRIWRLIPKAEKDNNSGNRSKRKRNWWQRFFFDEEGNWLGLRDDGLVEDESELANENEMSEKEKFEEWKRRAEAIVEIREAPGEVRSEESRRWEDWIVPLEEDNSSNSWNRGLDERENDELKADELNSERGIVKVVRDMVLGGDEEDMLYEDRVFQYASWNSAKFLAVLIIVPWVLDFLVHDYVFMPFLDRYVKTVPLAAQMLDVRRNQKINMVDELKLEKARYRLEVEIGKSPPLSDDELWWELRGKALEMRDEWRLENRKAFANIWSDTVFGISLFVLLYSNQSKVALLKFTGNKILNNISDTGKAFLIILVTDIFLGYHSESGWETVLEIITDHYGLEVEHSSITIFICLFPVIIDACVKLWLFKFLPKLSPKVSTIFQEMKRH